MTQAVCVCVRDAGRETIELMGVAIFEVDIILCSREMELIMQVRLARLLDALHDGLESPLITHELLLSKRGAVVVGSQGPPHRLLHVPAESWQRQI